MTKSRLCDRTRRVLGVDEVQPVDPIALALPQMTVSQLQPAIDGW